MRETLYGGQQNKGGEIGISIDTPSHLKQEGKEEIIQMSKSNMQSPKASKELKYEADQDEVTAILRKNASQEYFANGIHGGIFTQ